MTRQTIDLGALPPGRPEPSTRAWRLAAACVAEAAPALLEPDISRCLSSDRSRVYTQRARRDEAGELLGIACDCDHGRNVPAATCWHSAVLLGHLEGRWSLRRR